MSTRKEFREEHNINLKGKAYLPVAARVLEFRKDHPNASIGTEVVDIGDEKYVRATVCLKGYIPTATAHKRIPKKGQGKSAAKDYPVETAETGAIGRALGLCGYGTLAGDLDEGDEIADAPVEQQPKGDGAQIVTALLESILQVSNPAELSACVEECKARADSLTEPQKEHLRAALAEQQEKLNG